MSDYFSEAGVPHYWKNAKGELPAAMQAYISHCADPENQPAPSRRQVDLVIVYVRYHIDAPCWKIVQDVDDDKLNALRAKARTLRTLADVSDYINDAASVGLDPL